MAIFIDESNKDRKAAKMKWGWSPRGVAVQYRGLFNQDIRYTFIGAANHEGFVIPACDIILHKCVEKEAHPPVDGDRFVEYVRKKLVPVLGNYDRRENNSVVVMDNCSIHMNPVVRELIEGAGARIIYSAPYCPDLIPIEYMFAQWKQYLKKEHVAFNNDWYKTHMYAINSVTKEQRITYFTVKLCMN